MAVHSRNTTNSPIFVVDSGNTKSSFKTDTRAANFPAPNSSYLHFRNTSIIHSIENNTTGTIAFWYYPQGTANIEYFLQITNGNSASANGDTNFCYIRRTSTNRIQATIVNDATTAWNYRTGNGVISNDRCPIIAGVRENTSTGYISATTLACIVLDDIMLNDGAGTGTKYTTSTNTITP